MRNNFSVSWYLGHFLIWANGFCHLAVPAAAAEPLPPLPHYAVQRVTHAPTIDGRLDEPEWFAAPTIGSFYFPWHREGLREQTLVKLLWDDEALYIAHICEDRHVTARYKAHNDPIPQDDCFEIMLAPHPDYPLRYYNLEWNVLGGYIDGHRPHGPQAARVEWDVEGLRLAGTIAGTPNDDSSPDQHWTVELALPLRNFAQVMPHFPVQPGDTWRVNFNRHGGNTNMQYSQWSAADTPEPAFHVPHRFGTLTFVAEQIPFAAPPPAPSSGP